MAANSYTKIIKAATTLMRHKGYHGTSIQMIADKVGISKSTIFHHFKNKEAILLAILETTIPAASLVLNQLANDKELSGYEKLKRFLKFQMKLLATKGDVLAIYLSESKYLGKANKKTYIAGRRAYTDFVKQIIAQIQEEDPNRFKGLNITIVTNSIIGMCNWAIEWYDKKGKLSIDEITDQMYQIILADKQ